MKNAQVQVIISIFELIELLINSKMNLFGFIKTDTPVSFSKEGKLFYPNGLRKIKAQTLRFGRNYTRAINLALEKEGKEANFVAKPHNYKVSINEVIGYHKGDQAAYEAKDYGNVRFYVTIIPEKTMAVDTVYYGENGVVNENEVLPYLAKKYESQSQRDAGLEGEGQKIYVNPKIENIREITYNGVHYIVK